jgi:hypothetical protein
MSAVFLFHRDLRLFHNSALNLAIQSGEKILRVFIFNPDQIDPTRNPSFAGKDPASTCFMASMLTRFNFRISLSQVCMGQIATFSVCNMGPLDYDLTFFRNESVSSNFRRF